MLSGRGLTGALPHQRSPCIHPSTRLRVCGHVVERQAKNVEMDLLKGIFEDDGLGPWQIPEGVVPAPAVSVRSRRSLRLRSKVAAPLADAFSTVPVISEGLCTAVRSASLKFSSRIKAASNGEAAGVAYLRRGRRTPSSSVFPQGVSIGACSAFQLLESNLRGAFRSLTAGFVLAGCVASIILLDSSAAPRERTRSGPLTRSPTCTVLPPGLSLPAGSSFTKRSLVAFSSPCHELTGVFGGIEGSCVRRGRSEGGVTNHERCGGNGRAPKAPLGV